MRFMFRVGFSCGAFPAFLAFFRLGVRTVFGLRCFDFGVRGAVWVAFLRAALRSLLRVLVLPVSVLTGPLAAGVAAVGVPAGPEVRGAGVGVLRDLMRDRRPAFPPLFAGVFLRCFPLPAPVAPPGPAVGLCRGSFGVRVFVAPLDFGAGWFFGVCLPGVPGC
ncbi:hypothetical protein EAO77_37595 [Streptomyces sp. t39]|nr:hypothetical protein EAO77_37595 [Streptomyces sp. t39]